MEEIVIQAARWLYEGGLQGILGLVLGSGVTMRIKVGKTDRSKHLKQRAGGDIHNYFGAPKYGYMVLPSGAPEVPECAENYNRNEVLSDV